MCRALKANEVECRIGQVKDGKGFSLLLYKNARVDMQMLDEMYGPLNWQRRHEFKNGVLYCSVGVWDESKSQWIWKEDAGTESNTEKEKGQASDSFKRACVNLGIGRELYTAPFIWVNGHNKYDKFKVEKMEVVDGQITDLVIIGSGDYWRTSYVAYSMNGIASVQKAKAKSQQTKATAQAVSKANAGQIKEYTDLTNFLGSDHKIILKWVQEKINPDVKSVRELPEAHMEIVLKFLRKSAEKNAVA